MQAVILAAGESSRFWPLETDRHKSLFTLCGKPLIQHTIDGLASTAINHVIIVQGPDRTIEDELKERDLPNSIQIDYVVQGKPEGMGNALKHAEDLLDDDFFVLTPFRRNVTQFITEMQEKKDTTGCDAVLLSTPTDNPGTYGMLQHTDDRAENIVEKPDEGEAPSENRVVGLYLLQPDLFDHMEQIATHEYQYEDALASMMEKDDVRIVFTDNETSSIKYPWDLFGVARALMKDRERSIADSADIADSATIKGKVIIEDDVTVYENATIKGPVYIGEGAVVGNNAVIRNYSILEKNTVVGANTEIRNALLQQGTSTHMAFIGDSILGRHCSIGAGTVFANRNLKKNSGRPTIPYELELKDETIDTGRKRLGAILGDNVQLGTQANLMPGIGIGKDAVVGPSTTVFWNIGEGKTHYTRFEQEEK